MPFLMLKEWEYHGQGYPSNEKRGEKANDITADAVTGIDSILATDLVLGEDAQTKIDFGTANEIHFYANNSKTFCCPINAAIRKPLKKLFKSFKYPWQNTCFVV